MAIPAKIYFKLRPLILPVYEIVKWIPNNAYILDLGCGKGVLTKYLKDFIQYFGVDNTVPANSNEDNINYIQSDCLNFIKRDISKFNTFLIIDLLHHLPKKKQIFFIENIILKMKQGDILIMKDIYPRNFITKFWNSFHDFLISKQIINYFDFDNFEKNLDINCKIINKYHKRILLYDHYFLILKKL